MSGLRLRESRVAAAETLKTVEPLDDRSELSAAFYCGVLGTTDTILLNQPDASRRNVFSLSSGDKMVLVAFPAGRVRLVIRIYFYIVSLGVTFFGGKGHSTAAELALIKHGSVPVSRIGGWHENFALVKAVWQLRTIPGGWLGFAFMVVATVMGIVGDLAVTTWVVSQNVPSRCDFGSGLVFNTTASAGGLIFDDAPPNSLAFLWAFQAQMTSLGNGGHHGIYKKVNNDTSFAADADDTLGTWVCAVEPDITYQWNTPIDTVRDDLLRRGLLFDAPRAGTHTYTKPTASDETNYFIHAIWLTASSEGLRQPFTVRVAVQTEAEVKKPIAMRGFGCSLDAPEAATATYKLNMTYSVSSWLGSFDGHMFSGGGTPINSDAKIILERLLNSMSMIRGGNNYLLSPALPGDQKYGCLQAETNIPTGILVLIGIEFGFWLLLTVDLLISYLKLRRINKARQEPVKKMPYSQISWMVHAVRERIQSQTGVEAATSDTIQKKTLKNWELVDEDDQDFPRLRLKATSQSAHSDGAAEALETVSVMTFYPKPRSPAPSSVEGDALLSHYSNTAPSSGTNLLYARNDASLSENSFSHSVAISEDDHLAHKGEDVALSDDLHTVPLLSPTASRFADHQQT